MVCANASDMRVAVRGMRTGMKHYHRHSTTVQGKVQRKKLEGNSSISRPLALSHYSDAATFFEQCD